MKNSIIYRFEDGTFIDKKPMYFEVSRDGVKVLPVYMPTPKEIVFICAPPPGYYRGKGLEEWGKYLVIDRTYDVERNEMTIYVELIAKESPDERQ